MLEKQTFFPGITIKYEGRAEAAHREEARRIKFGAIFAERLDLAQTVFDSSVQGLPTPQTSVQMIDHGLNFNSGAARNLARAKSDFDSLRTMGIRRKIAILGVPIIPMPDVRGPQQASHRLVKLPSRASAA